jgi:hypothetical protein
MKRDMELVRKLLLFFDEKEGSELVKVPPIEGYDELTTKYHLVLMHDANLLRCEPVRSTSSDRVIYVLPFELTWEGHEFLDKIRADSVWARVVETVSAKGGSLAFSVVNRLATKYVAEMFSD